MATAKAWIAATEAQMERTEITNEHFDVGLLIRRYHDEIGAIKSWDRPYRAGLLRLAKDYTGTTLRDLTAARIVDWGKDRGVSPATVAMELQCLSATLHTAETLWRVNVNWPEFRRGRAMLKHTGLHGRAKKRDRRPEPGELDRIKAHLRSTMPMADLIDFAVASCMRVAEITRIRWDDIDEERRTVIIPQRKHPSHKLTNDQTVPLLAEAWEIIQRQPRADDRIFPYKSHSVATMFQRARNAAGVKDLRFHDMRHHGISLLFERNLDIPRVAMISGHADWAQLKRYTNLKPSDVHRRIAELGNEKARLVGD
ncbi:MAG: site-specific integrase [Pseudomonadota bacterium]